MNPGFLGVRTIEIFICEKKRMPDENIPACAGKKIAPMDGDHFGSSHSSLISNSGKAGCASGSFFRAAA